MSPNRSAPDPAAVAASVAASVAAIAPWLSADRGEVPEPSRPELAAAVRGTLAALAGQAPGRAVEVRVPPFAAVQCLRGPTHTRGTPPNVVETDARTWLLLAAGRLDWERATADGRLSSSGTRAGEVAGQLPLVRA